MATDPANLPELAGLTPEQITELTPLQKSPRLQEPRRSQTKFIMLPYKQTLAAVGRLQNAQLAVLVEIANQIYKTHQNPAPLPNTVLRAAGLSRKTKLRALRQLEEAGLVTVTWRGRKCPLVSIQQK
jgi:hypothetical protein